MSFNKRKYLSSSANSYQDYTLYDRLIYNKDRDNSRSLIHEKTLLNYIKLIIFCQMLSK